MRRKLMRGMADEGKQPMATRSQSRRRPLACSTGLALITALAAGVAGAQTSDLWYAGIGTGSSHVEVYRGSVSIFGEAWEAGPGETASLIFGGYRPSRYLAFDLAYVAERDLAWHEEGALVDGLPSIYDSRTALSTSALQLSLLGMLPFRDVGEVYLRGGLSRYRAAISQSLTDYFSGEAVSRSMSVSDTGFLLGLGVAAALSERWRARLEYQVTWIDHTLVNVEQEGDPTVDTWFLGFEYRFGPRAHQ